MQYFGMMILGIIIFLIVDILRWNKSTPDIQPLDTIKQYAKMNWLAVVGGLLISIAMLILAINGEFELLQAYGLPTSLSMTTAFLTGVGSTSVLKQWFGKVPEMKTSGHTIDTPPKIN